MVVVLFFFFKQKTAYEMRISDWSSDVCSSDLSADTALGKVAEKVRTKLEHENITLSSSDAEAKAEITPQGDLLIDGKKVATDEAQRALLLEYRAGIIAVAAAGTDIGMKGADFGLRPAGKALRGVFSGNSDEIEAEIEADARELDRSAEHRSELKTLMRKSYDVFCLKKKKQHM